MVSDRVCSNRTGVEAFCHFEGDPLFLFFPLTRCYFGPPSLCLLLGGHGGGEIEVSDASTIAT